MLQKGGELSDGIRMLSYKSCDPGFYNSLNTQLGFYDCVECDLGYYNSENEVFECLACSAGSFCNSSFSISCESVLSKSSSPPNSWNSANCSCVSNLQLYEDDCLCQPGFGYLGSSDSCFPCASGEYKAGWDLDSCLVCPDPHMSSLASSSLESDCVCDFPFVELITNTTRSCVCSPVKDMLGRLIPALLVGLVSSRIYLI